MKLAASHRTYSRQALAAEVGVSPRQISEWITKECLHRAKGSPHIRGASKTKYYDDTHVARIREILRDVYDSRVTLADYRERLHGSP